MAVFSATAKKRTLSRQATIFRPATATGTGRQGDPWYPPPCTRAVHPSRAQPTVHTARTLETTKVIGRRWSRWSIGTTCVRLHPRFGPDAPQNPHHAVAQGVRVQGPPGRRGKSTKLRVSDTLSFWRFLDPSADAASFCPTWSTFGQKIFFAQTPVSSRSSSTEVD